LKPSPGIIIAPVSAPICNGLIGAETHVPPLPVKREVEIEYFCSGILIDQMRVPMPQIAIGWEAGISVHLMFLESDANQIVRNIQTNNSA
jgi:hypothetical protein